MKILNVVSGPRRNKNTHLLADTFVKGVVATKADTQVTNVFLPDKKIDFCKGCMACKNGAGTCVQKDDMVGMYDAFKNNDVIVLATPVYWFNMTAQMKTFVDRLFALTGDDFKGKKIVLVATFEDTTIETSGCHNIIRSLQDVCNYLGMTLYHSLCLSTNTTQIKDNEAALAQAYEYGVSFAQA